MNHGFENKMTSIDLVPTIRRHLDNSLLICIISTLIQIADKTGGLQQKLLKAACLAFSTDLGQVCTVKFENGIHYFFIRSDSCANSIFKNQVLQLNRLHFCNVM